MAHLEFMSRNSLKKEEKAGSSYPRERDDRLEVSTLGQSAQARPRASPTSPGHREPREAPQVGACAMSGKGLLMNPAALLGRDSSTARRGGPLVTGSSGLLPPKPQPRCVVTQLCGRHAPCLHALALPCTRACARTHTHSLLTYILHLWQPQTPHRAEPAEHPAPKAQEAVISSDVVASPNVGPKHFSLQGMEPFPGACRLSQQVWTLASHPPAEGQLPMRGGQGGRWVPLTPRVEGSQGQGGTVAL